MLNESLETSLLVDISSSCILFHLHVFYDMIASNLHNWPFYIYFISFIYVNFTNFIELFLALFFFPFIYVFYIKRDIYILIFIVCSLVMLRIEKFRKRDRKIYIIDV